MMEDAQPGVSPIGWDYYDSSGSWFGTWREQVPDWVNALLAVILSTAFAFTSQPGLNICRYLCTKSLRILQRIFTKSPKENEQTPLLTNGGLRHNNTRAVQTSEDDERYGTFDSRSQPRTARGVVSQPVLATPAERRASLDSADSDLAHSTSKKKWSRTAHIIWGVWVVAWGLAGFWLSQLEGDDIAISSSNKCGFYELAEEASAKEKIIDDQYLAQKEHRAGRYHRSCYVQTNVSTRTGCDFFVLDKIKYDTDTQHTECPFDDKGVCTGRFNAVSFTTNKLPASVIGINVPNAPRFRRNTTCAPLSMKHVHAVPNEGNTTRFRYFYGPSGGKSYTLETVGDLFDSGMPAYFLHSYSASPWRGDEDAWFPDPVLGRPVDAYLTIMFITAGHIFYEEPNTDDIFSADRPCRECSESDKLYRSTDARARPLVCIDRNEICHHDGPDCWQMFESNAPSDPASLFVRYALITSLIHHAVQFRMGSALLAQEAVYQYRSRGLSDHQWIDEVQALFETSLARLQYNALDIATAADEAQSGYERVNPEDIDLCHKYIFKRPKGWSNFRPWRIITILLCLLLVWVFGQDVKNPVAIDDDVQAPKKVCVARAIWGSTVPPLSRGIRALITYMRSRRSTQRHESPGADADDSTNNSEANPARRQPDQETHT